MRKQLVRSARYVVVAAMVAIATAPSTADATLGAPSITGAAPAALTPLTPCRLVDTRTDPVQRADEGTIRLQVTGACDIPATASAVAITVVATATTQEGFVAAYPSSAARPLASVLNYSAGDTRANGTILALSPAGQIDLHTSTVAALVIDTTGYFSPTPDGAATAGRFVPLPPAIGRHAPEAAPASWKQARPSSSRHQATCRLMPSPSPSTSPRSSPSAAATCRCRPPAFRQATRRC